MITTRAVTPHTVSRTDVGRSDIAVASGSGTMHNNQRDGSLILFHSKRFRLDDGSTDTQRSGQGRCQGDDQFQDKPEGFFLRLFHTLLFRRLINPFLTNGEEGRLINYRRYQVPEPALPHPLSLEACTLNT